MLQKQMPAPRIPPPSAGFASNITLEASLMMTYKSSFRPRCWHILAPQIEFPKPKFHFGQQVGSKWQDDKGNSHYDIGIVIGMMYGARDYNRPEWTYLTRMLKCDSTPWIVGSDDGCFIYESQLVADFTKF